MVEIADQTDLEHLRHAIRLSEQARLHGNRPFGAVLVSETGTVLAAAENRTTTSGELTAHAEINALQIVAGRFPFAVLARSTMYASGEPCPMCTGALIRLAVRRVVFGIRETATLPFLAGSTGILARATSCRDFFRLAPSPVEVVGPLIEEEARAPFEAFAARGSKA